MFNNLDLATLIASVVTLLIAFTVHEFAHAWTAVQFGDDTPRMYGRLSLNPMAHLDVMGSLMLIVAGFGWAKPVPINPYILLRKSSAAVMWVSLAGPLSNFLLALIAAVPLRLKIVPDLDFGIFLPSPEYFLYYFIIVNLTLALFNLIPVYPLDGEKIAEYFLPPQWARYLEKIRPYGAVILMAVFFVGPMVGINLFSWLIRPALSFLLRIFGI